MFRAWNWLEHLAAQGARVARPTITDPRGTDLAAAARLKQQDWMVALERRAIAAFQAMDVLMTDTCINYQTIMPAVFGEHMAYGDTGVVIYTNSVLGARSNFEGGPSALSAGLTGRTPRYGFHLEQNRRAHACRSRTAHAAMTSPTGARWAASSAGSPAITGRCRRSSASIASPSSDEMKHFGAALASYGSVAMFHMQSVTPEGRAHDRSGDADARDRLQRTDIARFPCGLCRTSRADRCGGVLRAAA